MILRGDKAFPTGFTSITELDGAHPEMMLDFGILVLDEGETFRDASADRERAFLLLDGTVEFVFDGRAVEAERQSMLDEGPWALHAAAGAQIELRARRRSEIVVERIDNLAPFETTVYSPDNVRSQRFGEGTMQETSTRTVRTIFDAATNEASGMVLGEVINHPGKWSSYPPHSHAHPEIYHYRLFPDRGFGFSQAGDEVVRVTNRDTLLIEGGIPHPQTAGPGYAMFYVWMIPHLPGNRFGPDSREFDPTHEWVMKEGQTFWPDRPMSNSEAGEDI